MRMKIIVLNMETQNRIEMLWKPLNVECNWKLLSLNQKFKFNSIVSVSVHLFICFLCKQISIYSI